MIRIDMSEYMDRFSTSRLIGSVPRCVKLLIVRCACPDCLLSISLFAGHRQDMLDMMKEAN